MVYSNDLPLNILFLRIFYQVQNIRPSIGNWFLEKISLPAIVKLINAELHSYSNVCYYRAEKKMFSKLCTKYIHNFLFKKAEEKKYFKIQS